GAEIPTANRATSKLNRPRRMKHDIVESLLGNWAELDRPEGQRNYPSPAPRCKAKRALRGSQGWICPAFTVNDGNPHGQLVDVVEVGDDLPSRRRRIGIVAEFQVVVGH